jgi:diguanylate cyclase (GGDEF)-like protein
MEKTSEESNQTDDFLEVKNIPGFHEFIEAPLSRDEKSLMAVREILKNARIGKTDPFGQIIYSMTAVNIKGQKAQKHWKQILAHKTSLEQKIGRNIHVKVAAIDYFETIGDYEKYLEMLEKKGLDSPSSPEDDNWLSYVFSYQFFNDRIKEECQRSKRYGYPLSLVIFDLDQLAKINEKYGFTIGDIILTRVIKIVKRSIRNVDILSRFAGDQFAVILPHANKREALELSERIRKNIEKRSANFKEIQDNFTITLAVTQYLPTNTGSAEVVQRVRSLLAKGKAEKQNFVHTE